jgi:hypothetical protein
MPHHRPYRRGEPLPGTLRITAAGVQRPRVEEFGRIHHLPKAQLAAVVDGLRDRGLVDAAGGFTDAGRETKKRIEALTDELAAPAYDVLSAEVASTEVVYESSSTNWSRDSSRSPPR